MRARYYNVDIKRFINQDILTGDITDSPSLNRYAYCQGNPVNLIDPFGLSPEISWSSIGHTILDVLGIIPVIGDVIDVVNGIWYFAEGDWFNGTCSIVSALPLAGDIVGKGSKVAGKVIKGIAVGGEAIVGSYMIADAYANDGGFLDYAAGATHLFGAGIQGKRLYNDISLKGKTSTGFSESETYKNLESTLGTIEQEIPIESSGGNSASGYYQDVNGRWHRPNGQFASNAEMGLPSTKSSISSGVHGNSLNNTNTNYGYVLLDKDTGEILKFGETLYPNTRYSQSYLDSNNAVMKILESGNKADVHMWQYDMNSYYKYKYDEFPPLNSKGW